MMLTIGTSAGWSKAIFWSCGIAGESGDGVMAMARGGCAALLIDGNGRCRVTPEFVATAVRGAICGALRNAQVVWRSNIRTFAVRMMLEGDWTAATMVRRSRRRRSHLAPTRVARLAREQSGTRFIIQQRPFVFNRTCCEERRIGGT